MVPDRRSSDMSIAWAAVRRARRGIPRIRRVDARRRTWLRRAATATCTVLLRTEMKRSLLLALAVLALAPAPQASAQLLAAKDGPIVYGHHHLVVSNVADQKKFWIDALGGVAVTIGTNKREIMKFPNALLFMNPGMPSGGSKGRTVNHIGFAVPNLRQTVDKLKAGGYKRSPPRKHPRQ